MPVYSMTGYGNASSGGDPDAPTAPVMNVEMRSVNGRFLDLAIKASDDTRGLEQALRELVASRVKRGKVEVRVSLARDVSGGLPNVAPEQLMRLAQLEGLVQGYFPKAGALGVHEVLQWCRQAEPAPRADETLLEVARQALDGLIAARQREGERLAQALRGQAARVRELNAQARPMIATVVQRQQQRFLDRWREALAATGASGAEVGTDVARERALSEAAAYALRIDVAEELTRLEAHLDELDALLAKGGELGKRLDFLVQEMHREANTLGAKSQSIELTTISMDMRVAIEQMREQVQNIE
jgi:uncharacterized protein (TIGR00255 family)